MIEVSKISKRSLRNLLIKCARQSWAVQLGNTSDTRTPQGFHSISFECLSVAVWATGFSCSCQVRLPGFMQSYGSVLLLRSLVIGSSVSGYSVAGPYPGPSSRIISLTMSSRCSMPESETVLVMDARSSGTRVKGTRKLSEDRQCDCEGLRESTFCSRQRLASTLRSCQRLASTLRTCPMLASTFCRCRRLRQVFLVLSSFSWSKGHRRWFVGGEKSYSWVQMRSWKV